MPDTMNTATPHFSGYFACPLKAVYLQPNSFEENIDVAEDYQAKSRQAGFPVHVQHQDRFVSNPRTLLKPARGIPNAFWSRWAQDHTVILPTQDGEEVVSLNSDYPDPGKFLAAVLSLPHRTLPNYMVG